MVSDFYKSGSHNHFLSLCTRKYIKIWRLHFTPVSCSLANVSIVPMFWLALLLNGQTQGKGITIEKLAYFYLSVGMSV